jgi:hypothetical protein
MTRWITECKWTKKMGIFKRSRYAKECIDAYDRAADALNPHYDEWNAEYHRKYSVFEQNMELYNRFIDKKSNSVLKNVKWGKLIKMVSRDGVLVARSRKDKDLEYQVITKEVEF